MTGRKPSTIQPGVKKTSGIHTNLDPTASRKAVEPYKVPPDYVWKDVIAHEKILKQSWEQAWRDKLPVRLFDKVSDDWNGDSNVYKSEAIAHPFLHGNKDKRTSKRGISNIEFIGPKTPFISSEKIESQSHVPINYRKLFWTPGPLPIIRFVPQQYGYYRRQKYLQEQSHNFNKVKVPTDGFSQIKHTVNPLLC